MLTGERCDRVGIVVSAACAIHCTLLPLAAGLLPALGLRHFADERIEWLVILVTAVVGVIAHTRAYFGEHRHAGPGLLFVAGLGLVVGTRLTIGDESAIAPFALGVDGMFAAAAHWLNIRLCRCCGDCVSPR